MIRNISHKSFASAFFLLTATICPSIAQTTTPSTTDCSDIKLMENKAKISPNKNVPIYRVGNEPNGADGVLNDAIAYVSGKIEGVTFTYTAGAPPAATSTASRIEVGFLGNNMGSAGTYLGSYGVGTELGRGQLLVGMGTTGCRPSAPQAPCFDPSQPGYREAIVQTLVHELLHALRVGHSEKANVMNQFAGVNNMANNDMKLDCVLEKAKQLHRAASTPTPPPC